MILLVLALPAIVLTKRAIQPWDCDSHTGCVCQHDGQFTVKKYTRDQCLALSSFDGCIMCSAEDPCNSTNPPSGLYCWPHSNECSMCSIPNETSFNNLVAPGHTIYLRKRCKTTSLCHHESNRMTFTRNLTTDGGVGKRLVIDGDGHVVTGPCPMFVFGAVDTVTVRNMNIVCSSTTLPETAPAILILNIHKTQITIEDVIASGWVKSAVTVLGGQFDLTIPITKADLSGSSFSNLTLTTSKYRFVVEMALAMYYGAVDVGGLGRGRRIIVQPAIDPNTGVSTAFVNLTSNKPPTGLIVYNFSEWTRLFGDEYELILNDPGATLGFSLIEANEEEMIMLRLVGSYIIGAGLLILLKYWGTVSYLYQLVHK